jgi:hypothetical protein
LTTHDAHDRAFFDAHDVCFAPETPTLGAGLKKTFFKTERLRRCLGDGKELRDGPTLEGAHRHPKGTRFAGFNPSGERS